MDIKLEKIRIKVNDDVELELTMDEIKEFRNFLNKNFPDSNTWYCYPYYSGVTYTVTTSGSSAEKPT